MITRRRFPATAPVLLGGACTLSGCTSEPPGDGLFSVSSGNLSVPTCLGDLAFGWLFKAKSENDKYAHQIHSSAGIAVQAVLV